MALKTTIEHMKKLLLVISHDLEKSGRGNKVAAQRVRTSTIKFAKIAKQYRKESVREGKKSSKRKTKRTTKRRTTGKRSKKKKTARRRRR